MFNYTVIDKVNGGVCDRFDSEVEAREAYPDTDQFDVQFYSDEENAEIDAVFADAFDKD